MSKQAVARRFVWEPGDIVFLDERSLAEWDEADHPRVPAGHPDGGQWTDGNNEYMQPIGEQDFNFPFQDDRGKLGELERDTQGVDTGEKLLEAIQYEEQSVFTEQIWPNGEPTPQEAKAGVAKLIGAHLEKQFTMSELDRLATLTGAALSSADTTSAAMAEKVASRIVRQWATTSGDSNPLSTLVQEAIRQEFDLEADMGHLMSEHLGSADAVDKAWYGMRIPVSDVSATDLRPDLPADQRAIVEKLIRNNEQNARDQALLMRGLRAHVRAQYVETQKELASRDIDHVEVVRGASLPEQEALEIARTGRVVLQPASSFSTSFSTARMFSGASGKDHISTVVRARVDRKRILGFPKTGFGALHESEIVVLGGRMSNARIMLWWS